MAEVEDDSNKEDRWPWDFEKEELTPAVLAKIIENLPLYALHATYRKPEEVGMTDSLHLQGHFKIYCDYVRDHFQDTAKEAPNSTRAKLYEIAEQAIELIYKLLEYVDKRLNIPFDRRHDLSYPYSYGTLNNEWDKLVRKFDLCMSSQGVKNGQDESPLEENLEEQGTAGGQQTGRIKLPLKQRFAFSPGQVLFDGKDIGVKTGLAQDVLKKLVEHFGLVVKFKELDESVETSDKEASVQLRDAISHLNKRLKDLPIEIENRRGSGYFMSARD